MPRLRSVATTPLLLLHVSYMRRDSCTLPPSAEGEDPPIKCRGQLSPQLNGKPQTTRLCKQIVAELVYRFSIFVRTQGDQKVPVYLMITIQKVTSNVQSVPRQSPDNY
jgi:hypothetical protein